MLYIKTGKLYAKSLVQSAKRQTSLEAVYQDVNFLKQAFQANKALQHVFKSPIISTSTKLRILKILLQPHMHAVTFSWVQDLVKAKKETLLLGALENFLVQYDVLQKIQRATVTTACTITQDLRNKFVDMVHAITACKEVCLAEIIDPKIIGGFILKFDNKQVDNSVARRLEQLEQQFAVVGL
jgi:F-type H+-transporting ATPase subunit delta